MGGKNYDLTGGYSIVGIVLSDVLPAKCYHPDILAGRKTPEPEPDKEDKK